MKKRNAYKIKNTKDLFKKLKISKEILSKKQKNNLHKNATIMAKCSNSTSVNKFAKLLLSMKGEK